MRVFKSPLPGPHSLFIARSINTEKSVLFLYSQHPFRKYNVKNSIIYNSNNNHMVSSNKSRERYVRPLWKKYDTSLKDIKKRPK